MSSPDRLKTILQHLLNATNSKSANSTKQVSMATTTAGPPLTLHVLDTANGLPARRMSVTLSERKSGDTFKEISRGIDAPGYSVYCGNTTSYFDLYRLTNSDGRFSFLKPGELEKKVYKIRFETAEYFQSINTKGFYPYAEVVFEIDNPNQHYHVPLLLSPYSYSTYRGS